jgi:PAS domain S-box-containing protein
MAALILLGYSTFAGTRRGESPALALFYFLVPILLWAAMRLGLKGVSTSMIVVAFLSVWGASQGRGPFSGAEALNNVLSLQLFLVFVSIPFMVLAGIVEDQKRAQQTLIDEQTKLHEAQHLAQIGSWEWDPQSDEVTWSRELYRISGRDPGLPAPSFKEHSQLYTPESIERLKHVVDEALRIGTPYELDLEMVNRDGSTKWIRAQGEAQSDRTGRVVRLRGTTQDINERRLAERELERVNERLRLAMEAGKSVGWDRDVKTGRYTLFGNLQSIFGIPADTHDGRVNDFPRYLHSDDRQRVLKTIEDAMQTHMPYTAEFRVNWPDGAVRWVAARGKFYYSSRGEPERMLGTAVDITERKLAVEALRKSEEQLRLALRAGRMYAFDWDPITDVITRSEEVSHIPALKDDPLQLTKQQLLADVHPEDQEIFNSTTDQCTPENPNQQISFRLLRPDGSVLWLERTGRAFFDGQGRLVRMAGIVANITDRKLAEVALSSVSGRLIEAQEQERAWIARELHDDIGQRFALMVTNLEVMKKVPPASAAEIRNFINEHLKRVREISADVQAMSHRLHSSKLQFLGIVAAARSFCQELSDQQRVEIGFTYSEIPPAVSDEISLCLFRIMQESLQNAVKHSGVRHFEVELRGEPEGLHLIVRDSGVGFDPKSFVNNRGLGLISMQERVNLVKGIFSIKSGLNLGTTIHVRVPLKGGATFMSAAG